LLNERNRSGKSEKRHLILNTLAMAIMMFSGANFPVAQLPVFAQYIAHAFPLFRTVRAANMSLSDGFSVEYWSLLIGEFLLGIVYYIAAFVLLRVMERIAIRKAALEFF